MTDRALDKVCPGLAYRHKRTQGLYWVICAALMKIGGEWKQGVIYQSMNDITKPLFVREADIFKRNFEEAPAPDAPAAQEEINLLDQPIGWHYEEPCYG